MRREALKWGRGQVITETRRVPVVAIHDVELHHTTRPAGGALIDEHMRRKWKAMSQTWWLLSAHTCMRADRPWTTAYWRQWPHCPIKVPFDRRCTSTRNFKLTRKWGTFARLQCGVCASAPAGRCNCAQLRVTAHAPRFQPQPQAHRSLVTSSTRARGRGPGRAGVAPELARARWLHVGAGLATATQWPRLVHGEPFQPQLVTIHPSPSHGRTRML